MSEIDRIMELAKHRTGLLQEAVDGVGALRAVVSSEGGIVTATVDGLGALVDLRITDAITAMNSQTVAALHGGNNSPGSSTVQRRTRATGQ